MNNENSENRYYRQFKPEVKRIEEIVKKGNTEELNKYADELGDGLRYPLWRDEIDKKGKRKTIKEKELSSSQIRNILDSIQRMYNFNKDQLQLIRPKLAYIAGRHGGRVRELQEIIDKAILLVENDQEFENFKNFIEAIVAYHRYHGGE